MEPLFLWSCRWRRHDDEEEEKDLEEEEEERISISSKTLAVVSTFHDRSWLFFL